MKKLLSIIALAAACLTAIAQDNSNFLASYQRQVRMVGVSGVGVESIIKRWEAAIPNDPEVKLARFSYYFNKSQSTEVMPRPDKRYLGMKPILTLKDSTGADVFYYDVTVYNDSLYAESIRAVEEAIALKDTELRYRLIRASALFAYEKESPDMAAAEIMTLIDECAIPTNKKSPAPSKEWLLDAKPLEQADLVQAISEYCYSFFQLGTNAGYEYFFTISQKMNKLYPKEVVFIDNLGSYYQVARKDNRKAARYYKQALKLDPEDYAAKTNMRLIEQAKKRK